MSIVTLGECSNFEAFLSCTLARPLHPAPLTPGYDEGHAGFPLFTLAVHTVSRLATLKVYQLGKALVPCTLYSRLVLHTWPFAETSDLH